MFTSQNLSVSLICDQNDHPKWPDWVSDTPLSSGCPVQYDSHVWLFKFKISIKQNKKFSSQVHQPHFKCSNATCGEWPPSQPGQAEDSPIIAEFDWTALLQSITLCESIPTDHNVHNNCHLHLVLNNADNRDQTFVPST